MLEMLLKSLGLTPETVKGYIDGFKEMADKHNAGMDELNRKLDILLAQQPDEKENDNG